MVKVGNSECEFLKLTPLSRTSAIAGAVCGVTMRPRRPSGTNRIRLRGVAFCADAEPAASAIRPADSSTILRRISFSPHEAVPAIRRRFRFSFALRQDCYIVWNRPQGRSGRQAAAPRCWGLWKHDLDRPRGGHARGIAATNADRAAHGQGTRPAREQGQTAAAICRKKALAGGQRRLTSEALIAQGGGNSPLRATSDGTWCRRSLSAGALTTETEVAVSL